MCIIASKDIHNSIDILLHSSLFIDVDMTMSDSDDSTRSPGEEAFIAINGIPIYFNEDWDTGIGGGLWTTGLAIAKYFQNHSDEVVNNLKQLARIKYIRDPPFLKQDGTNARMGINALELGSGNGFLSVCLMALAANQNIPLREVVVTDLSDHLKLMKKTVDKNNHVYNTRTMFEPYEGYETDEHRDVEFGEGEPQEDLEVIIAEHKWGKFPIKGSTEDKHDDHLQTKKYDFIFGSDLAYRNSLHDILISSLLQFTHEHTLCLIGVTMTDTQPIFFDKLTRAGFRYEKLADHLLEKEFRGSNFGIFAIQRR